MNRFGIYIVIAVLIAGLALGFAGQSDLSRQILSIGIAMLILFPCFNAARALVAEVRRRDWRFAAAAFIALAILVFEVARAVRPTG